MPFAFANAGPVRSMGSLNTRFSFQPQRAEACNPGAALRTWPNRASMGRPR